MLKYRELGKTAHHDVGLLGNLTLLDDLDIITDICATHFKQNLEASFKQQIEPRAIIVAITSPMTFRIEIWVSGKKYSRIYMLTDIPVLNDFIFECSPKLGDGNG